jgi:hypothetical protein
LCAEHLLDSAGRAGCLLVPLRGSAMFSDSGTAPRINPPNAERMSNRFPFSSNSIAFSLPSVRVRSGHGSLPHDPGIGCLSTSRERRWRLRSITCGTGLAHPHACWPCLPRLSCGRGHGDNGCVRRGSAGFRRISCSLGTTGSKRRSTSGFAVRSPVAWTIC